MNIEDNFDVLLELSPLTDFYDHDLVAAIEEIKCTKHLQIVKLHEIDLNFLRTNYDQCYESFKNAFYATHSLNYLKEEFENNTSISDFESKGYELLNKIFINLLFLERARLAPLIKSLESIIKEFKKSHQQVNESLIQIHSQNDYHNCISNDTERLGKLFAIRSIISNAQNHLETCEDRIQTIQFFLEEANEFQNSILNPFVIENRKLLTPTSSSDPFSINDSESNLLNELERKLTCKVWIRSLFAPFVGALIFIPAYLLLLLDHTLFYTGIFVISILVLIVGGHFASCQISFPKTIWLMFFGFCCSLFFNHQFHKEIESYLTNNFLLYPVIAIGLFMLVYGMRKLYTTKGFVFMLKLIKSKQIIQLQQ